MSSTQLDEKTAYNEDKIETIPAVGELDTSEEERRLIWKLDKRILPILCLLYLFACEYRLLQTQAGLLTSSDLDRSNLGNARIMNLPQDILGGDPTGMLFDWVNSAFFFSYVSHILRILAVGVCSSILDSKHGSGDKLVETLSTPEMDGWYCYRVGSMFDSDGLSLVCNVIPIQHGIGNVVQLWLHVCDTYILGDL